ncbi:hypothetical protein PILCRDRAFT_235704 [Piloderma croceum F 1598]|uniref:Uncharacterized protein n=1 Tax=Piloderma croceum (strain F 1598) TaxID=765440 RepID=A0A0C3GAE5_PILCF|nr:hypothetical protein PILCRDRAFT_235704 [Piloderma croceum F 1598]
MMNDSETLDGALSQDVVVHTSLAISPDLNALLEHDERTRGPHQPDASSPHFWQSPHSGSSNSIFPVGLPPPPRGNRKAVSRPATPKESESISTRSKTWSEATEPLPEPSDFSPLLTNPFINAPPQLSHPHRSNVREQSNIPQFSGTFETLDRVVDPEPDPPRDLLHPVGSCISSVSGAQEGSASPRLTDQPTVRAHSVPRVEKLIGRGKSIFSISGSQLHGDAQAVSGEDESDSSGPTKREAHKNCDQSQQHSKSSTKEGGVKTIAPPMTDSSQPSSPRSPQEPNYRRIFRTHRQHSPLRILLNHPFLPHLNHLSNSFLRHTFLLIESNTGYPRVRFIVSLISLLQKPSRRVTNQCHLPPIFSMQMSVLTS